jgi:hypothetical protein
MCTVLLAVEMRLRDDLVLARGMEWERRPERACRWNQKGKRAGISMGTLTRIGSCLRNNMPWMDLQFKGTGECCAQVHFCIYRLHAWSAETPLRYTCLSLH